MTSDDGNAIIKERILTMKAFKKIAAIGAAMMIAVSMMSIGASAYTWKNFGLHYTYGAPSSSNVTSQTFGKFVGGTYDGTYHITVGGYLTLRNDVDSINNGTIMSEGYVFDNTLGTWALVVSRTYSTTGPKTTNQIAYLRALKNNPGRAIQTLNYSSNNSNVYAYGSVSVI